MKHPARLQSINHRLCHRIERVAAGQLDLLARAILLRIAVNTDASGRAWASPGQLSQYTGRPERAVRDAIVAAASLEEHPGLLLFVQSERIASLPWVGAGDTRPPPDAWGFWVPDAALAPSAEKARAATAASITEHIATADAYAAARAVGRLLWPVHGEGLQALLSLGASSPIAANVQPDNDLPASPSMLVSSTRRGA